MLKLTSIEEYRKWLLRALLFIAVLIIALIAWYTTPNSHSQTNPYSPTCVNGDDLSYSNVQNQWCKSQYFFRLQSDTSGLVSFNPGFASGSNVVCYAVAEGASTFTGVSVNAQLEGQPVYNSVKFRVVKTTATTVALISLTIAVSSTGTGVGATYVDGYCRVL